MTPLTLAAAAALMLAAPAALAQTETEEEQLVFLDVAGRSVQVPSSFAAAACGLSPAEVATDVADTTDPACALDEATAAGMGLTDDEGELIELTRQSFVSVEMPDGETRVQMPLDLAAQHCGLEEIALSDDPASVRQVACELTAEQAGASPFPGLANLVSGAGDDAGGAEGADGGTGG